MSCSKHCAETVFAALVWYGLVQNEINKKFQLGLIFWKLTGG
jgi:hypothetical protein